MRRAHRLSPVDIEVLLHAHVRPSRMGSAPAVLASVRMWMNTECIIPSDVADCYKTTSKGRATVEALCRTPEPEPCWLLPDGEEFIDREDK